MTPDKRIEAAKEHRRGIIAMTHAEAYWFDRGFQSGAQWQEEQKPPINHERGDVIKTLMDQADALQSQLAESERRRGELLSAIKDVLDHSVEPFVDWKWINYRTDVLKEALEADGEMG